MSVPDPILLVEDLAHCRAWLVQALQAAFPQSRIETADSVAGGLAALVSAPALAVVDLGLPDGSGMKVIEALRQRLPDCQVVVSSVFDDDAHLFGALRAGATGYVLKDEPVESLAALLRGIVAGQPPLSASIARRLLRHFNSAASAPMATSQPTASSWPSSLSGSGADSETESLTQRETEVLKLSAKGYSAPQIAELLNISRHTVSGYLKDVYRKLRISSRAEATLEAARRGYVR
jgi:DNA-binding NarL/FixJ family response regulator